MDCRTFRNGMLADTDLHRRLSYVGLSISDVTWDDTARNKVSAFGPNISDMTLIVIGDSPLDSAVNMPVIRTPNFSDKTVDFDCSKIYISAGNETGLPLFSVSLLDYLRNFGKHSGITETPKLDAPMDRIPDGVILSAQSCFLPCESSVTKGGVSPYVDFSVRLYNYQSSYENPAVIVIVCTSTGTTSQIVTENYCDLYHSKDGKKYYLRAIRLEDRRIELGAKASGPIKSSEMSEIEVAENIIKVVQVPLKRLDYCKKYSNTCTFCCSSSVHGTSSSTATYMSYPYGPPKSAKTLSNLSRNTLFDIKKKEKEVFHHQGPYGVLELHGCFRAKEAGYDDTETDGNNCVGYVECEYSENRKVDDTETDGNNCSDEEDCSVLFDTFDYSASTKRNRYSKQVSRGTDMVHLSIGKCCGTINRNLLRRKFVRDEEKPIRVTIQSFRVSDTYKLTREDIDDVHLFTVKILSKGTNYGSLVVDGNTGRNTELKMSSDKYSGLANKFVPI